MSLVEVALGAVIGIAATVIGVYANHFFEERREEQKAKVEEWKKVVDEVYSPLIFDMMQIRQGTFLLLSSLGSLLKEVPGKFTEEALAKVITSKIAPIPGKWTQSRIIEDILRKNSRLIRPSSLWLDLYRFYSFLSEIEFCSSSITTGIYGESPGQLLETVQGCVKIGEVLSDAGSHLRDHLGELVVVTTGMPQSIDYKPFFTDDIMTKLQQQHDSIVRASPGMNI